MPTDLTGTPTSLGIGTYNTSVDAPSGLGFNGAMAQIDALLVARTVGLTAKGDILYAANPNTPARLAIGSDGQVLTVSSGVPVWAAAAGLPSGAIVPFGGSAAPTGYVLCDGSTYDGTNATYTNLWTAIGLTYGGTGQSAFKVPDLQGRVAVGKSGAGGHADVTTLGNNDGVALASRRPKHAHTVGGGVIQGGSSNAPGSNSLLGGQGGSANVTVISPLTVGLAGMTDTPAYLVLNYIIKL